jgi:hypothetical protein
MVHYGRHIIDPATGLCEICDRGAIHDFRTGRRPGKQFLYSNQDGKFTYRPVNDEIRYNNEETTPRYVRKPLYPEPPPPIRTRATVYEEPVVQRKAPRHNPSPMDDTQHSPSRSHPATFYYVDNTGQMVPSNEGPPEQPPRRYIVQSQYSPPTTRPARVVQQRRARTPPPPASEPWRSPPKRRQNNSDTEIIQQPYRAQPNDFNYNQSPRKPEMYYIENPNGDRYYVSNDHNTTSPRTVYQGDTNRKPRQLEPIQRKYYNEPEPTVIKKVYKKLPTNRYQQPEEQYISNGNNFQTQRKVEKIYPSPRTYDSSPQLTNRQMKNALPNKNPSVYYIDTENGY